MLSKPLPHHYAPGFATFHQAMGAAETTDHSMALKNGVEWVNVDRRSLRRNPMQQKLFA